jgi:hypothetical protein
MRLFTNHLTIEKNFCVFLRKDTDYLGNENYFLENLNNTRIEEQIFSKKTNFPRNFTATIKRNYFGDLNFLSETPEITNLPYNFYTSNDDIDCMDFICGKNNFIPPDFSDMVTIRRRKRRKFASEEERRVARILKNRRTAEESRQRRIQKMRTLENFVSVSEEREKMIKEELHIIGVQSAIRTVELILTKKIVEE